MSNEGQRTKSCGKVRRCEGEAPKSRERWEVGRRLIETGSKGNLGREASGAPQTAGIRQSEVDWEGKEKNMER